MDVGAWAEAAYNRGKEEALKEFIEEIEKSAGYDAVTKTISLKEDIWLALKEKYLEKD